MFTVPRNWCVTALVAATISCLAITGCGNNEDNGAPVPSSTPTVVPIPTKTATTLPSQTPPNTATPVPTNDIVPTATRTNSPTTIPTAINTSTLVPTATATSTNSPEATLTATNSPTVTPTFVVGSCGDPAVRATEPLCALDDQTFTCDFLDETHCLLPYPSSVFLKADSTTPTGFRMNYPRDAMPANERHIHIDPTEWNTLDGFSPGTMIEAVFPGVDPVASNAASITTMPRSLENDSPTVIINAETGEHILHFAELDLSLHDFGAPAAGMLLIRPGIRLQESTRYIVAIRGLKDTGGTAIPPQRAFKILRDNLDTPVQTINARRAQFEGADGIFAKLASAGVPREDLILAWDFVVASRESLTGRAVSMRDQGLAAVGPGAPPFHITSVEGTLEAPYSAKLFRRIRGTYTVPLFVTSNIPPAMFNLDANGMPKQVLKADCTGNRVPYPCCTGAGEGDNCVGTAPFTVTIPLYLVTGDGAPRQGRPVVYGHGLLGSGEGEVTSDGGNLQTLQSKYGFVLGATDWIGLSENDVGNVLKIISDLSNFRQMPDRLQQGFLNFMLLGRLLTAADGFASDPAFQLNGTPLIDPQELYYYGISQGGIEGGAYMALSTETKRGVLGVGAANYSTLLQRSGDFSQYQLLFDQHYQNAYDRALLFPIIQQLWDRGEPNGYTSHLIADPLPCESCEGNLTPAKKILMQPGLHDSQVPNVATEIQARSLGIPVPAPSAWTVAPPFPEMTAPFDGSAMTPYDVSATPEPLTNTPPPAGDNGVHEAIRRLTAAQSQIDAFLRPDGMVQNFCDGPCVFHDVPGVN